MANRRFATLENLKELAAGLKDKYASKSEGLKTITRSGTTFTVTRADDTTFTFNQQDNTVARTTTLPKANGTAAIGSETKYAAGDHVHPTDTTRAAASDLTSHTGNTTVHVTANERTAWNGKADKGDSIKNITRSGTTFTATRADDTTFTFTQQDNTVAKTTTTPKANGTAAIGSETKYAAGDHVHPTDTTRAAASDLTSHTGDTTVHITASERTAWNGKAGTSTATQSANGLMSSADKKKLDGVATGATANTAASATPSANGTAAVGTSAKYAREDHVHPTDTTRMAASLKGTANGVAELDANGLVPTSQLPSFVDDVLEYNGTSAFPSTGETGKIYVDTSANKTYRWGGSSYVEISPSLALGETSSTAYRGDRGKAAYDHISDTTKHITAAERTTWNGKASTSTATSSANGLMASGDKSKLDAMSIAYATCSSAANAQAKVATVTAGTVALNVGATVYVKFTNTNSFSATADNKITLKIGDTEAKDILAANSIAPTGTNTTFFGRANYVNQYVYDGTGWMWVGSSTDNNNTYSSMSESEAKTGTATTARSITAKTLNAAITNKGYTTNTGTVTKVSTGAGLTGGDVTTTGTIKANLVSETKLTNAASAATETSGRVYPVALDKDGKLAANVPWTDTKYESKAAASGGTDLSLVTTGEKATWNAKTTNTGTITGITTTSPLSGSGTSGSVALTHANSGVTAASKGDTSNQTPGFGGTFKVPSGTVNATGHLTAFADHTVTIPSATATQSTAGLMSAADKTKVDTRGIEYIVGTQTAATGSWTGVTVDAALYTGKTIAYRLPYAGSGNASLNLTLSGGGTTGAKEVYLNNTRCTTHYAANAVIVMVYDGTRWRSTDYWNSNTYDRVLHNNQILAAAACTKAKMICGKAAGYRDIAANVEFDITYPVLYASAAIAANATSTGAYESMPGVNPATTGTVQNVAVDKMVYLKGTLTGVTFKCAASNFLTCTVPTSADGFVYMPLGRVAHDATTKMFFHPSPQLFEYVSGSFRPYIGLSMLNGSY